MQLKVLLGLVGLLPGISAANQGGFRSPSFGMTDTWSEAFKMMLDKAEPSIKVSLVSTQNPTICRVMVSRITPDTKIKVDRSTNTLTFVSRLSNQRKESSRSKGGISVRSASSSSENSVSMTLPEHCLLHRDFLPHIAFMQASNGAAVLVLPSLSGITSHIANGFLPKVCAKFGDRESKQSLQNVIQSLRPKEMCLLTGFSPEECSFFKNQMPDIVEVGDLLFYSDITHEQMERVNKSAASGVNVLGAATGIVGAGEPANNFFEELASIAVDISKWGPKGGPRGKDGHLRGPSRRPPPSKPHPDE